MFNLVSPSPKEKMLRIPEGAKAAVSKITLPNNNVSTYYFTVELPIPGEQTLTTFTLIRDILT